MHVERRRSPRIIVEPSMRAKIVGLEGEAAMVELSFDGFRLESPVAFVDQAVYEFLIAPHAGGALVRVRATACHCHVLSAEPRLMFETGFAFADRQDFETQLGVETLIESLTSVLVFD
jgi:hypothetical protein